MQEEQRESLIIKQYLRKSEHIFRTVVSGINKESTDKHCALTSGSANSLIYICVEY